MYVVSSFFVVHSRKTGSAQSWLPEISKSQVKYLLKTQQHTITEVRSFLQANKTGVNKIPQNHFPSSPNSLFLPKFFSFTLLKLVSWVIFFLDQINLLFPSCPFWTSIRKNIYPCNKNVHLLPKLTQSLQHCNNSIYRLIRMQNSLWFCHNVTQPPFPRHYY